MVDHQGVSTAQPLPSGRHSTPDDHYEQAFSRNIGLVSRDEQARLRDARVAIAGMGGVGGVHLVTLARTGVGRFTVADFDTFDAVNSNRQYGAFTHTYGRKKTEVMTEVATSINPGADLRVIDAALDEGNVEAFLDGADVVVDGLDFFVPHVRRLVYSAARGASPWSRRARWGSAARCTCSRRTA